MRKSLSSVLAAALMICGLGRGFAQTPVPRPKITGISHVGFFTSDLAAAEAFWHGLLGFDEAYRLGGPSHPGQTRIAFIKINDHQHIELFDEPPTAPPSMISHLCFAVDDINQMRTFLRAHGYTVPGSAAKTRAGDYAFEITDPNGLPIEFVQSLPDGLEAKAKGRFLPPDRISPRIYHVGYMVADAEKTVAFYRMLGFTETWRGGANPAELSWINMKVPDGDDYVELMLYPSLPKASGWGTKNHISLVVPDIEKAVAQLRSRPAYAAYGKDLTIHTGINQRRQVSLYDPDGTRVELMEPVTVTGRPAPWSQAPPPAASPARPFDPAVAAQAGK